MIFRRFELDCWLQRRTAIKGGGLSRCVLCVGTIDIRLRGHAVGLEPLILRGRFEGSGAEAHEPFEFKFPSVVRLKLHERPKPGKWGGGGGYMSWAESTVCVTGNKQ